MYIGCASLPHKWNVAVTIGKLRNTLHTKPCPVRSLATYASRFQTVGFRAEGVRFLAAGKSSIMPPKKKLKQSSLVKEENQGKSKTIAEAEDNPARVRKSKTSDDEFTEARPEGSPSLSQGVHPGTLP